MVQVLSSNVVLVGFGHRTRNTALPALSSIGGVQVVAIIDPLIHQILATSDSARCNRLLTDSLRLEKVEDLESTLGVPLSSCVAYVAVPHFAYEDIVSHLLRAGIGRVVQEKPLATTVSSAQFLARLANTDTESRLVVAAQRRTSARYNALRDWLPLIGLTRSVHVVDTLHEPHLDAGWRATKALCGGGVVADLGYHMLDALVGLFGDAGPVNIKQAVLLRCRPTEDYDVEDTAHIQLQFAEINVQIYLSRASASRQELIEVIGDLGVIRLTQSGVELVPNKGSPASPSLSLKTEPEGGKVLLARVFRSALLWTPSSTALWSLKRDVQVVRLIEAIVSRSTKPDVVLESISTSSVPKSHSSGSFTAAQHVSPATKFIWPVITTAIEQTVSTQLHKTISIYDNSGVFGTFESEFKTHLGLDGDGSYALLHNSGTNALHALYFALGITKGDVVAVPVYTFHATVSPLMQLGAIPVFVDAEATTGNLDPAALKDILARYKVKAVVVTHMWGQPCDMVEITEACKASNVLLVEDCSHAHGATIDGKAVGTFGDGAAWSLQGEKVISGGEGGISVTKHAEVHYRSLIHGHYNKRCTVEIPGGHPLRDFALTGAGLKNRAHPLAVAIALDQLRLLPDIHSSKSTSAIQLINTVCAAVPFLQPPQTIERAAPSWYVVVFNFDSSKAPSGVTREIYVKELVSRGLLDADMPKSTKPLYAEPLFVRPYELIPGLYAKEKYAVSWAQNDFPGADKFHASAVKLPVFYNDDGSMAKYAQVMVEVAQQLAK